MKTKLLTAEQIRHISLHADYINEIKKTLNRKFKEAADNKRTDISVSISDIGGDDKIIKDYILNELIEAGYSTRMQLQGATEVTIFWGDNAKKG